MLKKFFITIILIINFSQNVYANDFLKFPPTIDKIKLDMSYIDFKNILPESRLVVESKSKKMLTFFFENNELWNSAIFFFKDEQLKYFSILKLKLNEKFNYSEINSHVPDLLRNLIKNYGYDITKYVIGQNSNQKYYEPLIVWHTDSSIIYFNYTPDKMSNIVETANISIGFSVQDVKIAEYYPNIVSSGEVNFNELLSDEIKQIINKSK